MAEIDLGKVVGDPGAKGEKGDTGATPDITFTVSTGEAGTDVKVSQSGTAENPVVNLTIPRGSPGDGGGTLQTHAVNVNSAFVNSGAIGAESVGGIIKVGGYFETKAAHPVNTYTQLCTITGVEAVRGLSYSTLISEYSSRPPSIVLRNYNDVVEVSLIASTVEFTAGAWANFSIIGVLA